MTRISLRETYDNRSVIAQIAKVTDTAEDAAETVQQKAAEINDALTDVNAAVQAAEGAVTTANAASASAQQSAQTVAGYNTRLTTAEGEIDIAEGNITALQGRMTTAEGKITAIEGREPDYLKKTGTAQTVTSQIMVPTTATGLRDTQIANGTRIQNDLDDYQAMVRNSGGTVTDPFVVAGVKEYTTNVQKTTASRVTGSSDFWVRIMKWVSVPLRYNIVMTVLSGYYRDANFYGKLIFGCWDKTNFAHLDLIGRFDWSSKFKLTYDGSKIELWYHNTNGDAGMNVSIFVEAETGNVSKTSSAVAIPASEQVAEAEPDWASFTRKLDCTFLGWTQ